MWGGAVSERVVPAAVFRASRPTDNPNMFAIMMRRWHMRSAEAVGSVQRAVGPGRILLPGHVRRLQRAAAATVTAPAPAAAAAARAAGSFFQHPWL